MRRAVWLTVAAALAAVGLVAAVLAVEDTATGARLRPARATTVLLARNLARGRAEASACLRELDRRPLERRGRVPGSRRVALAVLRVVRDRKRGCLVDRARLVSAWTATMLCESNKNPADGGTYWRTLAPPSGYLFALQFDEATWNAHRGGYPAAGWFVRRGAPPTPAQQAVVASRLSYDGWPNCP